MIATLQLITLLVLGYLGTHFVAERVRRRFHIVARVEFLLLGILVGPHVAGIMRAEDLSLMEPVVAVAIGAIGLLVGLRFRFERLILHHGQSLQLAFFTVAGTVVLVGGVGTALARWLLPSAGLETALPAALALGTIAAVSGAAAVSSIRRELGGGGRLGEILETAARLSQVLATTLFGLVFCLFHVGETALPRPLTAVEWMAANVGFGIVLGVLFFLFLGRERDRDRLLLALIGIVLFASGTAYYLNLSPLFINFALGAMLSNTWQRADDLRTAMHALEGPLMVVLLVVAGASWNLRATTDPVVLVMVALCLVGRPLAMTAGGRLAFQYGDRTSNLTPWMGGGLVAHGGLAIVMALDFMDVYPGLTADGLLTAVILSVLLWEILAPSRIRSVLIDAEPTLELARETELTSPSS